MLVLSTVLLSLGGVAPGFAIDEEGCLTCHQYPGLTRPEMPKGFKVFHIDEQRYLKSPHGKLDCRKCHTTIEKIPHAGDTSVNCNDACHLSEKDKKMVDNYDLKALHGKEQSYITRLADGSTCRVCHRLYPHQSSLLARAFINMHIGFMTCETCHINRDKYAALHYDWTSSEGADFEGEPFGSRFNPNLSGQDKSTHFISRISVFLQEDGRQRSLVNTQDSKEAKAYLAMEGQMTAEEKEKRIGYFHRDIHKAQISVTCNECHSKHGILDLIQLGFSEKKATDLVNLNIKGLVTKYKVFYFPHMLEQ